MITSLHDEGVQEVIAALALSAALIPDPTPEALERLRVRLLSQVDAVAKDRPRSGSRLAVTIAGLLVLLGA